MLGFEGGDAELLLVTFFDGSHPNYKDNPIKVVLYVSDAAAIIEVVRKDGLDFVPEPATVEGLGNTLVAFAKDPDGS